MKSRSHLRHVTIGILSAALLGGCGLVPGEGSPPPQSPSMPAPDTTPPATPAPPPDMMPPDTTPPPDMTPAPDMTPPPVLLCSATGKAALEAGPIWNNADAQGKCPTACGARLEWTGAWWTTVASKMSVCECAPRKPAPVEAGPIWNNADAQGKCPTVCGADRKWTGMWWTTVPNRMSVCECVTAPPAKVELEAGDITDGADAGGKCPTACGKDRAWSGGFRTTVPGQMSVCECACQP